VSKALSTFVEQVSRLRWQRRVLTVVTLRLRHSLASRALDGWGHVWKGRLRLSQVSACITVKHIKRKRSAVLVKWHSVARSSTVLSHRVKHLVVKGVHGSVQKGFARWAGARFQAYRLRVASTRILWKRDGSCLRKCWPVWREASRTSRMHTSVAASIAFKWRLGVLRYHWNSWCEYSSSVWLDRVSTHRDEMAHVLGGSVMGEMLHDSVSKDYQLAAAVREITALKNIINSQQKQLDDEHYVCTPQSFPVHAHSLARMCRRFFFSSLSMPCPLDLLCWSSLCIATADEQTCIAGPGGAQRIARRRDRQQIYGAESCLSRQPWPAI